MIVHVPLQNSGPEAPAENRVRLWISAHPWNAAIQPFQKLVAVGATITELLHDLAVRQIEAGCLILLVCFDLGFGHVS